MICAKIKKEVDFENFDAKFKIHQLNQVAQVGSYQPDLNVSLFIVNNKNFVKLIKSSISFLWAERN